MRVVRELTASRSKLVAGKSIMAERFAELQQEYIKVLRIAELSRAASRSNLAKADRATNLAKQARHLLGTTSPKSWSLSNALVLIAGCQKASSQLCVLLGSRAS